VQGYYVGQTSYLTPIQLIGVAYIYNYFSDYELPYNDGYVEKVDFIRSVQDGMLPSIYNPLVVDQIFEGMEALDFFALSQSVYGFRTYLANSSPDAVNPQLKTMNLAQLTTLAAQFPKRLQSLINNSDVPVQANIEAASTLYWQLNTNPDDLFLRNFNNLIFLQKKKKVHQVPQSTILKAASMTFTPGLPLFFGMMSVNGFVDLKTFLRFYRFSSMYLEFDPNTS